MTSPKIVCANNRSYKKSKKAKYGIRECVLETSVPNSIQTKRLSELRGSLPENAQSIRRASSRFGAYASIVSQASPAGCSVEKKRVSVINQLPGSGGKLMSSVSLKKRSEHVKYCTSKSTTKKTPGCSKRSQK